MAKFDNQYEGVFVPLVTPLDTTGNVNRDALVKLIHHVTAGGANGLMPVAGTGEGVGLTRKQRYDAVEICVETSAGKYPVVPGMILPGLGDCIEYTNEYKHIGADGVMLLTPYYTSLEKQEDLVDYFLRFMDATEMPLMIENLPSRTGINMLPRTMLSLAEKSPLFVSVKECVRDTMQYSEVVHYIGNRVSVLCGFEAMMAYAFLVGSKGGVIATANVYPQLYVEMLQAAKSKDVAKVTELHFKYIRPFNEVIYASPNPGPMRTALRHIGIETGDSIEPVKHPSKVVGDAVIEVVDMIGRYVSKS